MLSLVSNNKSSDIFDDSILHTNNAPYKISKKSILHSSEIHTYLVVKNSLPTLWNRNYFRNSNHIQ